MIEISVIVPVFNIEKYIERCVNSVLAQTFEDFELIIIDDGSSDNSGVICDSYKARDSRVKVYHTENLGVSNARNLGIKKSAGRYITFVDGDDWIARDYLEQLYTQLVKNNCDICICGGNEIDEQMKELKVCTYQTVVKLKWNDNRLYEWPFFTYVIHRMLIKKEVLKEIVFNESLTNGEDVLFITELFLQAVNGVLFIPYVGYSYFIRSTGANQHKAYSKKKFSAIIAYEKRLEIMRTSGLKMNPSWYNNFVLEVYWLYGFMVYNSEYYDKEHANILFSYLKKYHAYSDVLGKGLKFKLKYWLMERSQIYLEHVLRQVELPHGHIVGD